MKRILYPLSAWLLFTAFFSCQKELHFPDTAGIIEDSIYLDKIYDIDMLSHDTLIVWSFTYDAQKRVTAMELNTGPDSYLNYYYYYNGLENLPFKHMMLQKVFAGNYIYDTETVYHTYDSQQRNSKDSTFDILVNGTTDTIVQVVNYSYAPGKLFGFSKEDIINIPNNYYYSSDTSTLDANNNIISSVSYWSFPNGTKEFFGDAAFTYDQHQNPFSLLSNFKTLQAIPNNERWDWSYQPHNNMLTYFETQFGYATTKSFAYTYKPNGLPATRVITSLANPEIYIYSYRALP